MKGSVTYYHGKIGKPNRGSLSVTKATITISDESGKEQIELKPADISQVEFVSNLPTFRINTAAGQTYTISTVNWMSGSSLGALGLGLAGLVVTLIVYGIVTNLTGYGIFGLFAGIPFFALTVMYVLGRFHKNNASTAEGGPTVDQWQAELAAAVGQDKLISVSS